MLQRFLALLYTFFFFHDTSTIYIYTLSLHDALPISWVMLVLNLPFKALMFLTLMRPSLVLFLVLWLKLVKDFLKVRCRLALLPFLISCLIWLDLVASLPLIKERILVIILLLHFQIGRAVQQECRDRKSGSAGMPRPISYAVFCLKKKMTVLPAGLKFIKPGERNPAEGKSKIFLPWNEAQLNFVSLRSSLHYVGVGQAVKGRDERPKNGRP